MSSSIRKMALKNQETLQVHLKSQGRKERKRRRTRILRVKLTRRKTRRTKKRKRKTIILEKTAKEIVLNLLY